MFCLLRVLCELTFDYHRSNPGSTVDLVTTTREDGVEIFDKFYVCFEALRTIWRAHCRPIFGIDGCFLKSSSAGQLLAAVGRDANNQIYLVAWGVVDVESADNWKWFIQLLKTDLNLEDGDGFTLISNTIAAEDEERSKWCKKRTPGPNGVSEVSEKSVSYSVNIESRTCTCRMWDVTGIPYPHALKVFVDKKLKAEDYVADCYLTTTWKKQYSNPISPVEGMKFWKEATGPELDPPPRDNDKGRKKNPQKRKKGIYESPTKGKKVSRHLKVIHCYRCGMAGHNALHCKYDGVPNKPRKVYPRKKKHPSQSESMSFDQGEAPGPSQPMQT